jgi:hypothetical protein
MSLKSISSRPAPRFAEKHTARAWESNHSSRFTLENVDSGLGPTVTLIVGGLLWLVYLAPSLRDRHESRTIERNARRISATAQDLGIRSRTPMNEMSTRELVEHRRELERIARVTDRHEERAQRQAVFAASPALAARHRTMKLWMTLVIVASIAGAGVAFYLAAWSYLILAAGCGLLALIGLVAVNTAGVSATKPVAARKRVARPVAVDETWTPIRTPPVHRSIPDGAGLIVTEEHAKAIAARERATRIREQAARASQPGVAADPRFAAPSIETEAETTGTFDISAALRARRAN